MKSSIWIKKKNSSQEEWVCDDGIVENFLRRVIKRGGISDSNKDEDKTNQVGYFQLKRTEQ